ncbi:dTMP kinase [bacterium]|nr:dTMP kinase [bacterium]
MSNQNTKGKFIVIEGGDGAGKSTLIKRIRELYPDSALVCTREPGGSPFAEEIRRLSLESPESKGASSKTQFGLVWAARHDHMTKLIVPALSAGKHVLCDRFDSSTYAYQICGQADPDLRELFWTIRDIYLGDHKPDLYVFLDIDLHESARRTAGRPGENHFDTAPLDFKGRVRAGYPEFFTELGRRTNTPVVTINTNGLAPDAVAREFVKTIRPFFGEPKGE